jgi:hypothetical protein
MYPSAHSKFVFGLTAGLLALFAAAQAGCSKVQTERQVPSAQQDPLIEERLAKDEAFKSGQESPILEQARAGFKGLSYYAIDPSLRFSVKLQRHPAPKMIRLSTNSGEIRRGLRYGYFEFRADGQTCRLQVYRLEDSPGSGPSLFIPFRDATSGIETYAAGRYIDLKENTSGVYDLDFNRAYNPYCAYNSKYSCPVPPAENTLAVAIRAGEKAPSSAAVH